MNADRGGEPRGSGAAPSARRLFSGAPCGGRRLDDDLVAMTAVDLGEVARGFRAGALPGGVACREVAPSQSLEKRVGGLGRVEWA